MRVRSIAEDGLASDTIDLSRDAILEESARFFARDGFRKARLEDVASQLGVTRAALYYHFKNKQEILFQIHLRAIQGLLAGAEAIAARSLPVDQKLRQSLAHHAYYVAQNARYIGIFHEEEVELSPQQRAQVNVLRRRYADGLIDLYGLGVELGCFRAVDPKLAVFTLLGACNWIHRWYQSDGSLVPLQIGELTDDLLANGYLNTARQDSAKRRARR